MRFPDYETVTSTYTTIYDIRILDGRIRSCFAKEIENIHQLKEKLQRFEWIRDNSEDKYEASNAKTELSRINTLIKDISTGHSLSIYVNQTKELLELYDEVQPKSTTKVFGVKKSSAPDPHLAIRLKIIAKYLLVAKKYYPLNISRTHTNTDKCPECCFDLEDDFLGKTCSNTKCGYFIETFDTSPIHRENNQSNKLLYSRRENFAEGIRNFQGKQPKRPVDKVFEIIETEIELYHIDRTTLTKHALLQILRSKKLADNYADLNLIHSIITGISPPDISEYESILMYRYDLFEEVYETIKSDERQNSLHIQYVLRTFLRMEDYKCDPNDFITLKTRDVVLNHDQVMKKACEILAKKFPSMNWQF